MIGIARTKDLIADTLAKGCVGDALEFAGFHFEVAEMDDRRVAFVMISKIKKEH